MSISAFRLSVIFVLAALGFIVAEQTIAAIQQGLADSREIRVASATSCSVSADSTHFTGCSSIL